MAPDGPASPYDAPELYDVLFETLEFDVPVLLEAARAARGPVLEVGCGTGRVLLRLAAAGLDVEGIEPSAPMRERFAAKAAERGLVVPVHAADMRVFSLERRFGLVACVFNAFSHMGTLDDQLAAVRCMLAHLAPGGTLLIHQSQLSADMWMREHDDRVLEHETVHPSTGNTLRIYDTRTKDRVAQTQDSIVEIEETEANGTIVAAHRSETRHRWLYRNELELLLRHAGCARVEFRGDDGREPLTPATVQMWAFAWKD